MKQETVTIIYKCDLCGSECQPIRSINQTVKYDTGGNPIRVSLKLEQSPYYEDVCQRCLFVAMSEMVKDLAPLKPAGNTLQPIHS